MSHKVQGILNLMSHLRHKDLVLFITSKPGLVLDLKLRLKL